MDNEVNIGHLFEEIKGLVISSRNKVYSIVNTKMLNLYLNTGKIKMKIQGQNMESQF